VGQAKTTALIAWRIIDKRRALSAEALPKCMAKTNAVTSNRSVQREYWLPHQKDFDVFYNSQTIQVAVACIIGANFLTNIVEKEIDPGGDKYKEVFDGFELFYNVVFTIELGVNMYAHWFRVFWSSAWNIFDVVVVSIGIITMLQIKLPPGLGMLRMMRAFRVFRLFKRVHSLNKIIKAIVRAIPGMLNSFLILAIFISIFAILAVELYHDIGEGCHNPGSDVAWMLTTRGFCMGAEYFGYFSRSFYSFFQALTGESWSEAIARPSMWVYYDKPLYAFGGGIYFIVYFIITAFILTNVVVAVLLDKMVDPDVAAAASKVDEDDLVDPENDKSIETVDELESMFLSLQEQIEDLIGVSNEMHQDLSTFATDMETVRREVTCIFNCIDDEAKKQ
jgi:hypothetical protein